MQPKKFRRSLSAIAIIIVSGSLHAGEMDPQASWPLCGRITENPPTGWVLTDGCPAERFGSSAHTDAPLAYTIGPRLLGSEGDRYDFHRGLDIPTPLGTPIFAAAAGEVQTAGEHPSYSDPLIRIRHYRPGATTCSGGGGCYNTLYLHISDWVVSEDQWVDKGQLIGYTGASGASGWEHLHFEVRDAPAWDPSSSWSRDAVTPFRLLPYDEANDTQLTFGNVDATDPQTVQVEVSLTSNRYDLLRVELTVFDDDMQPVEQPGATVNALGYHVNPPFYDLEGTNFHYTHKNSSTIPWSSFDAGGAYECPYHQEHGNSYDAALHMDRANPANYQEGLFNGVLIRTSKYWHDGGYALGLVFQQLTGPVRCIEARAVFESGDDASSQWGQCEAGGSIPAAPSGLTAEVSASGRGKTKTKTVSLFWQDNADNEDVYVVERCQETGKGKNKSCPFSVLDSLPPDTTSYDDAPGSGTFQYRVKGRNDIGDSSYSNTVKI